MGLHGQHALAQLPQAAPGQRPGQVIGQGPVAQLLVEALVDDGEHDRGDRKHADDEIENVAIQHSIPPDAETALQKHEDASIRHSPF